MAPFSPPSDLRRKSRALDGDFSPFDGYAIGRATLVGLLQTQSKLSLSLLQLQLVQLWSGGQAAYYYELSLSASAAFSLLSRFPLLLPPLAGANGEEALSGRRPPHRFPREEAAAVVGVGGRKVSFFEMLTCIACTKQIGGSLEDYSEDDDLAGGPSTRQAIKALTSQV